MKKRFLSAVLALAMVLTMLPVSVFAADPTSSDPGDATVTMAADGKTLTWSYKDTTDGNKTKTASVEKTSGVIVGNTRSSSTGTVSGKYYSDFTEDAYKAGTSFTLLGDASLPTLSTDVNYKNITVDVNGHTFGVGTLTWTLDANNKVEAKYSSFNNLTVKNTGTATSGAVTGGITVKGMNFTLNMTNVASDSSAVTAELDNTGITTNPPSNTLTVTLNNSKMGTITAKNAKISVNATNKSQTGDVITAATTTGANPRTGGSVTLGTSSKIDGTLGMYGQGTVSLTGRSQITGVTTLFGGKKGDGGNADATPAWKTTMTVDNSTTGEITQDTGDLNGHKIDVKNNSTVGNITMNEGGTSDIDIADSKPATAPTVSIVAGTVDIKNSNVGAVTAGKNGEKAGATITVGTRNQADTSEVGNIEGVSGGATPKLVLNSGKVGTIGATQTVSYEIWGGSTKTEALKENLKGGLGDGYQIDDGTYNTYTTKFQDLVDAYLAAADASKPTITRVGETLTGSGIGLTFQWEDTTGGTPAAPVTLAVITIETGGYFTLPTEVNKTTVEYWYDQTGSTTTEGIPAGKTLQFTAPTTLSTKTGENPAQKLTGVKAVDASDSNPIVATIDHTAKTINLSGALATNAGTGKATVTLEIDGTYLTGKDISVGWYAPTGTITLSGTAGDGITYPIKRSDQVQIYDTLYTVTGTGLKAKVSKVVILGTLTNIPITVSNANGGMSGSYTVTGQNLKEALETVADSNVNFSNATGVKAALNALVAGLSDGSVTSMVNSARSAIAAYENKVKAKDAPTLKASDFEAYDTVELSPYLDIVAAGNPTISGSGNPTITLTMTLKYRYKVKTAGGAYAYKDKTKDAAGAEVKIPWEQTGNLTVSGDCGQVVITLKMPAELKFSNKSYAHHDGQVYEMSWTSQAASITNLNGFTVTKFEINNTAPTVTVTNGSDTLTFDNLQDAVNAVKNNGTIEVNDNFNGTITVSGAARKFIIKAKDNSGKTVTITGVNGAATTYNYNTSSNEYEIQLTEDNKVTVNGVAIYTNSATGGSGTASATSVKPGETVTYTPKPSAGYQVSGVSVKTNTGATVNVTANANGTYSFTVPSGVTSVTVTPSFTKTDTKPDNPKLLPFTDVQDDKLWYYDGVAYCYLTEVNGYKLMQGNSTTVFGVGRTLTRAHVAQMLYNLAGRPASPAVQYPFYDVPKTHWAYDAVNWAARNGLAEGYGNGNFGPDDPVLRDELVVFLWRYAKKQTGTANLNGYTDGSKVPTWAQAAMRWAASGILSGTNGVSLGNTLSPRTAAYREQVAVTVMNFHRLYG